MNSLDIEILELSNCNPEKDIVLAYVDVGKMPPQRAKQYLEEVKERMHPKFEKRGFDVIYIARTRDGNPAATVSVSSKSVNKRFDDAIKTVE